RPSRFLEDLAQRSLRFAQPLRIKLGAIDSNQWQLLLAGERASHGRLACSRRSRQQNTARRGQPNLLINLVAHMRMLNHGIQQPLHLAETAKRGKCRSTFLDKEFASSAWLNFLQASKKIFS